MAPKLEHYQQFKETLDNYQVSQRALKATENLRLVLLLGPTSAGKSTIIRHQLQTGRYYLVVSDTTRPPRENDGVIEQNGKEYWFKTEKEMLAGLKAGEYLEAEIIHDQQVSGISIRELEKAKQQGKIAINDVDSKGVHNILRVKPDTIVVMLIPPSFEEWLRRLAGRGYMSPEEQRRRFETALRVLQQALENDYYLLISEDIEKSGAIIDTIVEGRPNSQQKRGRELIESLKQSLSDKLTSIK
jgi:guanylate kinase